MSDRPRILIVEDDPATLSGLKLFLEGAGYLVVVAAGFSQADHLLQDEAFDLMITDLDLPGGTGLQLIRGASKRHPSMKSILMTAYGCATIRQQARDLDLYGYFEKPFSPEAMLTLVGQRFFRAEPDRSPEIRQTRRG